MYIFLIADPNMFIDTDPNMFIDTDPNMFIDTVPNMFLDTDFLFQFLTCSLVHIFYFSS